MNLIQIDRKTNKDKKTSILIGIYLRIGIIPDFDHSFGVYFLLGESLDLSQVASG